MYLAQRRLLIVLSAGCCAALASAQVAKKTIREPIRTMTFNIRCGTANDGANRWDRRAHIVVSRIRAIAPDILGVQEPLHSQVQQLEQALPAYRSFGAHDLTGGVQSTRLDWAAR